MKSITILSYLKIIIIMNNITKISAMLIAVSILITSCTSNKVATSNFIEKRKYTKGYYISSFTKNESSKKVKKNNEQKTEQENIVSVEKDAPILAQNNDISNTEEQAIVTASTTAIITTPKPYNYSNSRIELIKKDKENIQAKANSKSISEKRKAKLLGLLNLKSSVNVKQSEPEAQIKPLVLYGILSCVLGVLFLLLGVLLLSGYIIYLGLLLGIIGLIELLIGFAS